MITAVIEEKEDKDQLAFKFYQHSITLIIGEEPKRIRRRKKKASKAEDNHASLFRKKWEDSLTSLPDP